jgi:sodium/hydrogen antiporter
VGVSLANHWDIRGVVLGFVLITLIRPPMAILSLLGTPLTTVQRTLIGWFGIRGIGSVYYLAYAYAHSPDLVGASRIADLVIPAIATSIVLHGISAQPLMQWYDRRNTKPASSL